MSKVDWGKTAAFSALRHTEYKPPDDLEQFRPPAFIRIMLRYKGVVLSEHGQQMVSGDTCVIDIDTVVYLAQNRTDLKDNDE